jgi:hypothetical protein
MRLHFCKDIAVKNLVGVEAIFRPECFPQKKQIQTVRVWN